MSGVHLATFIKQFENRKITKAKKGVGSFLNFDLGESGDTDNGLHIWVYLCDWRLFVQDSLVLESDFVSNKHTQILKNLEGKKLRVIDSKGAPDELRLLIGDNIRLILDDASDIYGVEADVALFFKGKACVGSYSFVKGFYK